MGMDIIARGMAAQAASSSGEIQWGNITGNLNDQTDLANVISAVSATIGDLSALTTADKTSIVNAINELVARVQALESIPDGDEVNY